MELYYLFEQLEQAKDTLHKEKEVARARKFKEANPDKCESWRKAWYEKNGKEYHREYYKKKRRK